MFERFFRKPVAASGNEHPLATAAGLTQLLRGLPKGRDRDLLDRVDEALEDLGEQSEAVGAAQALEAALALDAASRDVCARLLAGYFSPHDPDRGSLALLERLANHEARLGAVYSDLFTLVGARVAEGLRLPVLAAAERYLTAWALHRRLARFRQRPAGKASWQQAHGVVTQLLVWRLLPDTGSEPGPVLRQYLQVVYEETVPWGNLNATQLELAARVIARRDGLNWQAAAGDTVTHVIDLALGEGPHRVQPGAVPAIVRPTLRFLSTASLRRSVDRLLAALRAGEALPDWLAALALEPLAVSGALQTLSDNWSQEPPSRQSAREERYRPVLGAFGFDAARELLSACEKLRKAGAAVPGNEAAPPEGFVSELNRDFAAYRFGGFLEHGKALPPSGAVPMAVPGAATVARNVSHGAPAVDSSTAELALAALRRQEAAIPNLALEHWTEIDVSNTGIGVLVPAMLPRHSAGVLVAWRYEDEPDWRVGIVRRVGRDAQGRPTMGIELLPPALPGVLNLLKAGSQAKAAWKDAAQWLLALIPGASSDDVLLPVGSFVADMPVNVLSAAGERHGRMRSVRERGGDWECVTLENRS